MNERIQRLYKARAAYNKIKANEIESVKKKIENEYTSANKAMKPIDWLMLVDQIEDDDTRWQIANIVKWDKFGVRGSEESTVLDRHADGFKRIPMQLEKIAAAMFDLGYRKQEIIDRLKQVDYYNQVDFSNPVGRPTGSVKKPQARKDK